MASPSKFPSAQKVQISQEDLGHHVQKTRSEEHYTSSQHQAEAKLSPQRQLKNGPTKLPNGPKLILGPCQEQSTGPSGERPVDRSLISKAHADHVNRAQLENPSDRVHTRDESWQQHHLNQPCATCSQQSHKEVEHVARCLISASRVSTIVARCQLTCTLSD